MVHNDERVLQNLIFAGQIEGKRDKEKQRTTLCKWMAQEGEMTKRENCGEL